MTPFLIRLTKSAATTGTFPLVIPPILRSCTVCLEELLFVSVSSLGETSRSGTMRRSGGAITGMAITVPATRWRTGTRARRRQCGHATVMKFVLHTDIFLFPYNEPSISTHRSPCPSYSPSLECSYPYCLILCRVAWGFYTSTS